MTKQLGDRLPADVLAAFDGEDLQAKIGPAYVLLTVDPEGTPRPCMLSAGEILAVDDRRLRVALWPKTHTARNLAAGTPVLLVYVTPGSVLYVRGRSRPLEPGRATRLERFEIAVESIESDLHAGMPVTHPITFSVGEADPARVAADWSRQIDDLRSD